MNHLNVGIFGQSRVGFSCASPWTAPVAGVNWYNWQGNNFSPCCDPAGAGNGSIWPHAGHLLMNAQPVMVEQVTFGFGAENGSGLYRWVPGGDLYQRFGLVDNGLRNAGLKLNAIIWGQGEYDATISQPDGAYYNGVISIVTALRTSGITAPFFVCQTTECRNGVDNSNFPNSTKLDRLKWQCRVQTEQRLLMLRHDLGIYEGSYFDQIRDLWDETHFGTIGAQIAGLLVWETITLAIANGTIQLQTQPLT